MTQPAFAVVCDICRKPGDDHYAVGEMTVCGGCWDPFGEFDHVSERACEVGLSNGGKL